MVDEIASNLTGPIREPDAKEKADSLVILCHGYGANGDDLIGLADQWRPLLPTTVFCAPNAPEKAPLAPNGYQWFALGSLSREERAVGTRAAAPILNAYIDQMLTHYKIDDSRLALVGFSQGTMLSLEVGLRRESQLSGILGYSGALAAPERLVAEIRSRPPIMLIHGDRDAMIPFTYMYEAVGALEAAGLKVEKHLCSGVAHGISPEGLQKGGAFLCRNFG